MKTFARLADTDASGGRLAVEVVEAVSAEMFAAQFHPALVAQFVEAPAETVPGSILNGAVWTNPTSAGPFEPAPVVRAVRSTLMTPIRFKSQFSVEERLTIVEARRYVGDNALALNIKDVLDILFGDLDDPRLQEVDVADPAVISGIDFCRSVGILTEERAETIKLGVPS